MPRKRTDNEPTFLFAGFDDPNTTPVPDVVFDLLAPELTEAELRVLLYIIRRTYGFKKSADDISLKQLVEGITTRDGRTQDRGAGVAKSAASRAVRGLVEKGIITAKRNSSKEKGDEPTTYTLRSKGEISGSAAEERRADLPVFSKRTRGGPSKEHARVLQENPQETVLQQTDNISNFERSHDNVDNSDSSESRPAFLAAKREQVRDGNPVSLGEVLKLRGSAGQATAASSPSGTEPEAPKSPRRGTPVGSSEERELLAAYLGDFVIQLGDEAPLSSTVTRTLKILKQANVPMGRWPDLLYQAKSITWEHSPQIKKKPSDSSKTGSARVRIPYYLAVLESLVGLRPAPTDSGSAQAT